MCEKCDKQITEILADPAWREKIVARFAKDAMSMAGGFAQIIPMMAGGLHLGAHQGSMVAWAALQVFADQVLEAGVEGKARELGELVRQEIAKVRWVQRVPLEAMPPGTEDGLSTGVGVFQAEDDPPSTQKPGSA